VIPTTFRERIPKHLIAFHQHNSLITQYKIQFTYSIKHQLRNAS